MDNVIPGEELATTIPQVLQRLQHRLEEGGEAHWVGVESPLRIMISSTWKEMLKHFENTNKIIFIWRSFSSYTCSSFLEETCHQQTTLWRILDLPRGNLWRESVLQITHATTVADTLHLRVRFAKPPYWSILCKGEKSQIIIIDRLFWSSFTMLG